VSSAKNQAIPLISVEDDKVALGPMRRDLIPLYQAWINDLSVNRFLVIPGMPMTIDQEIGWYDSLQQNSSIAIFTIYERETYRPVGNCNLHKIDHRHRTAELGIAIGEKDARGRGVGTAAVRLLCDWGFNALELNSIMLETYEWNIAGQKAYVKAGFREVGRRREARYFAGRYWDAIYYDLLRSEFESPIVRNIVLDGLPFEHER
jgi:diamine N-acetyltransferase